jgi:hypothetical protein
MTPVEHVTSGISLFPSEPETGTELASLEFADIWLRPEGDIRFRNGEPLFADKDMRKLWNHGASRSDGITR